MRNTQGYSKDQFSIDLEAGTVECPAGHTAPIRPQRDGGEARFATCARLSAPCGLHHRPRRAGDQHPSPPGPAAAGASSPARPGLAADLSRPPADRGTQDHPLHPPAMGGRKARCRGQARILTDILTRAGAINLARLAILGLHYRPGGWAIA